MSGIKFLAESIFTNVVIMIKWCSTRSLRSWSWSYRLWCLPGCRCSLPDSYSQSWPFFL